MTNAPPRPELLAPAPKGVKDRQTGKTAQQTSFTEGDQRTCLPLGEGAHFMFPQTSFLPAT